MLKRGLNVGFSGGEKKRMEILQMALLEPSFCILDETDSGLDIDALRVVAEGVNALRSPERSFLVITHYQRLLNYIVPDSVHVMAHGRIARRADPNWRLNSKPTATPITAKPRRREMAEITVMKTPVEAGLAQQFEAAKSALPGDPARREQAFRLFAERGLPHRRVEEFKYTDLRALMREAAPLAPKPSAADAAAALCPGDGLCGRGAVRLALVNGHVSRENSDLDRLPAGVEIAPLAEALASGHPLLAQMSPVAAARDNVVYQLNAAFMSDGAVIRVAPGAAVETPVHLRFVNAGPAAIATRVLVVVEEGASVTLLESHEGPDGVAYQPNGVVEFVVGDHAAVRHVRLNAEGRDALALSTLTARLGAHVSFDTLNVVVGAAVSRHQIYLDYAGEHSTARVNGADHARTAASTPTPRSSSIMPCRTASRASCSKPLSTTKRPACSRERSSSGRMRRRRTAA